MGTLPESSGTEYKKGPAPLSAAANWLPQAQPVSVGVGFMSTVGTETAEGSRFLILRVQMCLCLSPHYIPSLSSSLHPHFTSSEHPHIPQNIPASPQPLCLEHGTLEHPSPTQHICPCRDFSLLAQQQTLPSVSDS